jgi:hypothetical protein
MRTSVRIVTSQGSAYGRFRRSLERGTPLQIRAAAAELATVNLEDALAICLAFLDQEAEAYPRAAAKWASRVSGERPVSLADAQLLLAALGALPGPGARAGAEALIELCGRYQLRGVDVLLGGWLERRGYTD